MTGIEIAAVCLGSYFIIAGLISWLITARSSQITRDEEQGKWPRPGGQK